ncbi:2OG-Fe(II) oxygenase family protein [bacterium]|jgi:hypothetical protein|nr:2OG-Fe(II) oxygenase family protein [bacterium]|tara:strand:+ start:74 stop:613 length:540 start_codon:yes stop_codon:yes gene_type:complete
MKKSTLIPSISVNYTVDHNKHKAVLLDYFSKEPKRHTTNGDNISNTDWKDNGNKDREWIHYFKDNVFNQIQNHLLDDRLATKVTIHNIWFQQYEQNDYHGWHTHTNTQFTNVYYVELPDVSMKTEILGEEDIEIREGDILSFPAYMFHRSKENKSTQRKTVISFNTSFDRLNIDILNKM